MVESLAQHRIQRPERIGIRSCNPEVKRVVVYKAINIHKDILLEHGVRLPYKKAWMRKKVMRVVIHQNEVASYDLLL